SQFHQGSSESGVAVFSHAALQARVAATVLSGAESGVTADLPPVVKPAPITDLSIDDHAGHSAQTARLFCSSSNLQLKSERTDLFLQREEKGLAVPKQLLHPLGHLERTKVASLPPALHRLQAVIDHETAPLGFQLLARFDQLLPLPMDGSLLLFLFRRHTYQSHRITIALDKTVQL